MEPTPSAAPLLPREPFKGLRVVMVAPCAPPAGGIQVQADMLTERLRAERASVVRVRTNASVPAMIAPVGPVAAAWRRARFRSDLVRAIADGADVLHVHGTSGGYFTSVVAVALREGHDAGMRTVLRWDGCDADRFFAQRSDEVRTALANADEVVVASGWLAETFAQRMGRSCRVVPNLVADPDPEVAPVSRASTLRLLCARQLVKAYGVDVVLRAVAIAASDGADVHLTVVGGGPERPALADQAARTLGSRASVLGPVPHARFREMLRDTDVVVNGSWVDNSPVALAEALSAGVPVATTDAGGIRWVVQHGRTGLVTPVGDADALARSIVSLARDRALLEDLAWRAKVEALRWTWASVRGAWAQCYRADLAAAAPAA